MRLRALVVATALVLSVAPAAAVPVDLLDAIRSVRGQWAGSLVDFTKEGDPEYEMRMEAEITPDRAFVVWKMMHERKHDSYFSMDVVTQDPETNGVSWTRFYNRHVDHRSFELTEFNVSDATAWDIVVEADAELEGRPARLRITRLRRGNKVSTREEARFGDSEEWTVRTESHLNKVGGSR